MARVIPDAEGNYAGKAGRDRVRNDAPDFVSDRAFLANEVTQQFVRRRESLPEAMQAATTPRLNDAARYFDGRAGKGFR